MEFTAEDLYGPDPADRAAAAVRRLFDGEPVRVVAVSRFLGVSDGVATRALRTAESRGLVRFERSVGWFPSQKARKMVD